MSELIFREATQEDYSTLLKFEQNIIAAERPFHPYIKTDNASYYDIESLISDDNSYLIVVESSSDILGTGYAQIRSSNSYLTHDVHCYLGFIYLEPECRGKNIGKGILDVLMEWGVDQGASHFHLEVYADNESAVRAYQKAGFKNVSMYMEYVVGST